MKDDIDDDHHQGDNSQAGESLPGPGQEGPGGAGDGVSGQVPHPDSQTLVTAGGSQSERPLRPEVASDPPGQIKTLPWPGLPQSFIRTNSGQ